MGFHVDGGVIYTAGKFVPPPANPSEGNMVILQDKLTYAAALAASDVLRFGPFPAGVVPDQLIFEWEDMDVSAGTLTWKIGYSYLDGTTGDDDAFVAAGSTDGRTVSAASGTRYYVGGSKRVELQRPWYLDITAGAAGDDAAGTMYVSIYARAVGAK